MQMRCVQRAQNEPTIRRRPFDGAEQIHRPTSTFGWWKAAMRTRLSFGLFAVLLALSSYSQPAATVCTKCNSTVSASYHCFWRLLHLVDSMSRATKSTYSASFEFPLAWFIYKKLIWWTEQKRARSSGALSSFVDFGATMWLHEMNCSECLRYRSPSAIRHLLPEWQVVAVSAKFSIANFSHV